MQSRQVAGGGHTIKAGGIKASGHTIKAGGMRVGGVQSSKAGGRACNQNINQLV